MGLFEFVFGKGAPKDDTQGKQAFYLSDDDAKTFGNIDYMRSSKTVRRTFAKKKGKEHLESVRSVSAMKMTDLDGNRSNASVASSTTFGNTDFLGASKSGGDASVTQDTPSTSTNIPAPQAKKPRRTPGSNDMDMFRNMAKDIRK
ncbi:MAG: hypothetical protein WA885_15615 [Phormidesmis sp.]